MGKKDEEEEGKYKCVSPLSWIKVISGDPLLFPKQNTYMKEVILFVNQRHYSEMQKIHYLEGKKKGRKKKKKKGGYLIARWTNGEN